MRLLLYRSDASGMVSLVHVSSGRNLLPILFDTEQNSMVGSKAVQAAAALYRICADRGIYNRLYGQSVARMEYLGLQRTSVSAAGPDMPAYDLFLWPVMLDWNLAG